MREQPSCASRSTPRARPETTPIDSRASSKPRRKAASRPAPVGRRVPTTPTSGRDGIRRRAPVEQHRRRVVDLGEQRGVLRVAPAREGELAPVGEPRGSLRRGHEAGRIPARRCAPPGRAGARDHRWRGRRADRCRRASRPARCAPAPGGTGRARGRGGSRAQGAAKSASFASRLFPSAWSRSALGRPGGEDPVVAVHRVLEAAGRVRDAAEQEQGVDVLRLLLQHRGEQRLRLGGPAELEGEQHRQAVHRVDVGRVEEDRPTVGGLRPGVEARLLRGVGHQALGRPGRADPHVLEQDRVLGVHRHRLVERVQGEAEHAVVDVLQRQHLPVHSEILRGAHLPVHLGLEARDVPLQVLDGRIGGGPAGLERFQRLEPPVAGAGGSPPATQRAGRRHTQ